MRMWLDKFLSLAWIYYEDQGLSNHSWSEDRTHGKGWLVVKLLDSRRWQNWCSKQKVLPWHLERNLRNHWVSMLYFKKVIPLLDCPCQSEIWTCPLGWHTMEQCLHLSPSHLGRLPLWAIKTAAFFFFLGLTCVLPIICIHNYQTAAIWSKYPSFRHWFSQFTLQLQSYFIWPYRRWTLNR